MLGVVAHLSIIAAVTCVTRVGAAPAVRWKPLDRSQNGKRDGALDLARAERDFRRVEQPHVGEVSKFDERRLSELRWRDPQRPAGVEQLSARDIQQGEIGDCWVLAPLGAAAEKRPDALRRRIEPLPGGGARVTLDNGADGPRTHRVDATVPEATEDGTRRAELHAGTDEVTLARAGREGGRGRASRGLPRAQSAAGRWHDSARVLEDFTGQRAELRRLGARSDAQILSDLGDDRPAVLHTRGMRDTPADKELFDRLNLVDSHAYWVSQRRWRSGGARQPARVRRQPVAERVGAAPGGGGRSLRTGRTRPMTIHGAGVTRTPQGARVAIMLATADSAKLQIADAEGERTAWVAPGEPVRIGGVVWTVAEIVAGDQRFVPPLARA